MDAAINDASGYRDPSPVGLLALDAARYQAMVRSGGRSFSGTLRLWLFNPEFRCVAIYRLRQAAQRAYRRNRLLGLLPMVLTIVWRRRVDSRRHVYISREARIGPGLYIAHAYGIMVGPSPIGDNCVLHQNVTIGDRVAAGDNRVPSLGKNVWVGPGATVTGNITIGDNVTISAGTVISKSVPDGCLVAGNPGRVVQLDYDNSALMGPSMPRRVQPGTESSAIEGTA